ncbi:MAG: hypothetical protein FJ029_14880, partial [Actinobacteria bacterium]|nr:hypothetical protein [Actinomycetota bacterium]
MSGPTGLRLFALAAALAWLAAMPAAPARAAGPGAITGAVQNGTVGAAIPAGLVVGLETYRGAIPVASQTVTAGPDGSFAFSDLDTGPEYGFVARTTHAGVLYGTDLIRLDADGRAAATITVHEITPDDPGVSLRTATRFLRRRSAEVISVLEVAELQVPGDRTFVPQARPGVPPPIRFGLPAEAFNLEPLSGFGSTDAVFGGPGFGVYAPLRPGLATLAFGFEVALTDGAGAFAWTIGKPVDRVRVLGDVDGLDVRVTGLDEIGLDQVGDAVVRRWEGQALPAG